MKSTIAPATERTVTIEMTETEAKYFQVFFGEATQTELTEILRYCDADTSDRVIRVLDALSDSLDETLS